MSQPTDESGQRKRRFGAYVVTGVVLILLLSMIFAGGLYVYNYLGDLFRSPYLHGHREARTILPADRIALDYRGWVTVSPGGRQVIFCTPSTDHTRTLMLLDVNSGQETPLSKEMCYTEWLDNNLLLDSLEKPHYIVDLQSLAVIKVEVLPRDSMALPTHIDQAGAVYLLPAVPRRQGDWILLLERNTTGGLTAAYSIEGAQDVDSLLAGRPYKTPPPTPIPT